MRGKIGAQDDDVADNEPSRSRIDAKEEGLNPYSRTNHLNQEQEESKRA